MATSIDLSGMSRQELRDLQKEIEKQLQRAEREERKMALAAAEAAAREAGFSLNELLSDSPKAAKGKQSLPAKYRDPETGKTWSGRGRRPAWVKAAGDDLSKFEI